MTQKQNMSGHTACLLCETWARLPYQQRWTTPTTVSDTEGAMMLGFWVRARAPQDLIARLCERHSLAMFALDEQQEKLDRHKAALAAAVPTPAQEKLVERQGMAAGIIKASGQAPVPKMPPIAVPRLVEVAPVATAAAAPETVSGLSLLSVACPKCDAGPGEPCKTNDGTGIHMGRVHDQRFKLVQQGGTQEQVASDEPQQGAKIAIDCPLCGKKTVTGELHACP